MRLITPLPALVTGLALVGCGDKDTGTEVGGGAGVGSVGDTYVDEDGDGFLSVEDCDDADASTYPGAPESCDGIDNDCDGEVDENPADAPTFHADRDGDGFGDDATTEAACEAPDGFVEVGGDCDDEDPSAFPGNDESCDGLDNDCDGD
ncbi:MAG: putative metal-binding motif-containing protein, partial [Myxococcota bacterium]|nr:putative metal-binding motif-containing protein [Myxococcota bacterium]